MERDFDDLIYSSVFATGLKYRQNNHAAAKSRQSCLTLCDLIDGSPLASRPRDSPGKHAGVG